jgi:hypothetical protein
MNRPPGRVPNVIIAGVSKCGTTSLFRYLASHPDVCASAVKEVNFFTHEGRDSLDLALYGPQFERCAGSPRVVYLEASPIYLHYAATVAPAIKATLPDVRLVFILRHPIDRFVSHFRYFQVKAGLIPDEASLDVFVEACATSDDERPGHRASLTGAVEECLAVGEYAANLQQYLDLFGPDRVFVGFLEQLERSPFAFMRALCGFLGLPADVYRSYRFTVENRRRNPRFRALNRLAEVLTLRYERFFNRHPAVRARLRAVYHRVNPDIDETDAHRLTPAAHGALARHYTPSVRRLAAIMQRHYPASPVPEWLTDWPSTA